MGTNLERFMSALNLTEAEILSLSCEAVWTADELTDEEQQDLLEYIADNAADPHCSFWRMDSICKLPRYLRAEGFNDLEVTIAGHIRINAGCSSDEEWFELRQQDLSLGKLRARHLQDPFYAEAAKSAHYGLAIGMELKGQYLAFDPATQLFRTKATLG